MSENGSLGCLEYYFCAFSLQRVTGLTGLKVVMWINVWPRF